MKGARNENSKQSKQGHVNTPRPDIRDEMDSRKDKEAGYKENDNKPDKKRKKYSFMNTQQPAPPKEVPPQPTTPQTRPDIPDTPPMPVQPVTIPGKQPLPAEPPTQIPPKEPAPSR